MCTCLNFTVFTLRVLLLTVKCHSFKVIHCIFDFRQPCVSKTAVCKAKRTKCTISSKIAGRRANGTHEWDLLNTWYF